MSGGRRGASETVLRAIGLTGPVPGGGGMSRETAKCSLCGSLLEFGTDVLIGNAYEKCTGGRSCPNSRPHPPRPEPNALDNPPRRRRNGHTPFVVVAALLMILAAVYVAGIISGLVLAIVGAVRLIGGVHE